MAFIPILRFFMHGYAAVVVAAAVSRVARFVVGAARSLVTVRSWRSSGMDMMMVGAIEGAVTYLVGIALEHAGR